MEEGRERILDGFRQCWGLSDMTWSWLGGGCAGLRMWNSHEKGWKGGVELPRVSW